MFFKIDRLYMLYQTIMLLIFPTLFLKKVYQTHFFFGTQTTYLKIFYMNVIENFLYERYNFVLICKSADKICYSIIGYIALIRTLNLIR